MTKQIWKNSLRNQDTSWNDYEKEEIKLYGHRVEL